MADYQTYVYDEAFNDALTSFDQYVQESVVLIITGVVVLIGLLITLIKKIFFDKKTIKGSADSVCRAFEKIDRLLSTRMPPLSIHVTKGLPIDERPSAELLADAIRAWNTALERVLDNPKLNLNKAAVEQYSKLLTENVENLKKQFVERTYDTGDLRGYVKDSLKAFREAASELKKLETLHKKLKKSSLNDTSKERFDELYKLMVKSLQDEKGIMNEWYTNIKNGIDDASEGLRKK